MTLAYASETRTTGVEVVGAIPWGTHFCLFYDTKATCSRPLSPTAGKD